MPDIISLDNERDRRTNPVPKHAPRYIAESLRALDCLGVALASYNHEFTESERYQYELAVGLLLDQI